MNRGLIGAIIAATLVIGGGIGTLMCVEKVKPGYVAVQYSVNGGVKDELLTQGWHIVAPGIKTTDYSIATETFAMTADERSGSKDDESFKVTCSDGEMNVDFEMQYSFTPEDVIDVFNRYKGLDGEKVVSTNLRSRIKTVVNEVLSNYSILEAHLEKKSEVNSALTSKLKEVLSEYGITVESATLPETRVSEAVQKSISERTIKAQELEAEKMAQERVKLQAETERIKAEGAAKTQLIAAEAQAESNRVLADSLSEELIRLKESEAKIIQAEAMKNWTNLQVIGTDTIIKDLK